MISRSKSASSIQMPSPSSGWDWRSTHDSNSLLPPNSPSMGVKSKDWRTAISTPINYRLGGSTVHFRPHLVLTSILISLGLILLFHYHGFSSRKRAGDNFGINDLHQDHGHSTIQVSRRYPLTSPIKLKDGSLQYKIAIVTDLDTTSKVDENKWVSYFRYGELIVDKDYKSVKVNLDDETDRIELTSNIAAGGRGMELSELSVFNGQLFSVDDRTGIIYKISSGKVIPWVILADGAGNTTKGFKGEWMTVKDDELWVGGLGKEWTSSAGEFVNGDPMFVKRISPSGEVKHIDWRANYVALREKVGITSPGYMIHEAVCWSPIRKKWIFLPRRASNDRYDDVVDEEKGTNYIIAADEDFKNIEAWKVGKLVPTHGFSSFKFLPGSQDEIIIALKSEEYKGDVATYMLVFNYRGDILLPETRIGSFKYEGVEFV